MSKNYEKVKKWYDKGIWNETMCRNAVVMGWITPEEFTEITGEEYSKSEREEL
ncbi:MAG: XkdX family protein [Oscillospiraceae bacterium]|nr:XkdX family protein [Oscillospiraceae bacterium]